MRSRSWVPCSLVGLVLAAICTSGCRSIGVEPTPPGGIGVAEDLTIHAWVWEKAFWTGQAEN